MINKIIWKNAGKCHMIFCERVGAILRKFNTKSLILQDDATKYLKHIRLHNPGENFKDENYIATEHTHTLLKEHLKQTGGQVRTRFPPEPNGLLHIGHAKAININFGYAQIHDGICFLRFDDTNPVTEDQKFAEEIVKIIEYLGFRPNQVTYASDYFQQLYEWAEKLIEKDMAYVCHQPQGANNEEFSPWRTRPKQESLHEFQRMRNSKYKEGEATLRLKMTTDQCTVDPVAYRIKYIPHHRTKTNWCIYPTYDYAHSLCDSIENITHSFCTSEFALRRSTYYWVCNALQVYCPVQIEYGRLNLLYTVVSKRKIKALIKACAVEGWDDPRLYTLAALQRRGFPPEVINTFCQRFGLRKDNAYIHPEELHNSIRDYLQETAPRIMAVLNPLKVIITNFSGNEPKQLKLPDGHTISFDKEIWIEQDDFQESASKGFRRLTLDQAVGLKYTSHVIAVKEVVHDSCGKVNHLKVECTHLKAALRKPKAFIHWVSRPLKAEVRLFKNLFKSERPDDAATVPDGFLSDINLRSLITLKNALIGDFSHRPFLPLQRFQFERIGYFCVDSDSQTDRVVFNQIVELKQNKGF